MSSVSVVRPAGAEDAALGRAEVVLWLYCFNVEQIGKHLQMSAES